MKGDHQQWMMKVDHRQLTMKVDRRWQWTMADRSQGVDQCRLPQREGQSLMAVHWR
jgi:hypothetical protein